MGLFEKNYALVMLKVTNQQILMIQVEELKIF